MTRQDRISANWWPPVPPLGVYRMTVGPDTVVATTEADAVAVWEEHTEEKWDDDEEWERLAEDKPLTICLPDTRVDDLQQHDQRYVPPTAKLSARASAREWAEHNGRGFLCSTEW